MHELARLSCGQGCYLEEQPCYGPPFRHGTFILTHSPDIPLAFTVLIQPRAMASEDDGTTTPQFDITTTGDGPVTINANIAGGSNTTQFNARHQHVHTHSGLNEDQLNARFRETLCLSCPTIERANLIDNKGKAISGTCEWVLATAEYREWLREDTPPLLWIWGDPAKGKTMLSIYASQELEKEAKTIYFF